MNINESIVIGITIFFILIMVGIFICCSFWAISRKRRLEANDVNIQKVNPQFNKQSQNNENDN